MNLMELNYQKRKLRKEANQLLDLAVMEGRNLSVTEQIRFDSLTSRIAELNSAIIQRENIRKMVA